MTLMRRAVNSEVTRWVVAGSSGFSRRLIRARSRLAEPMSAAYRSVDRAADRLPIVDRLTFGGHIIETGTDS